jgi:hypothetical protein
MLHSPGLLIALFPALLSPALAAGAPSRADAANQGKPALEARLELDRNEYELRESISCTLRIVNHSSKALTVPDVSFVSGKAIPEGLVRSLQHRLLKIAVRRDGRPIEAQDIGNRPLVEDEPLPTVQLQPGKQIAAAFELCKGTYPHFFSIDRPGKYEVSAALDTTDASNRLLWRGRTATSPASFIVTEVLTFREKKAGENDAEYARAKIRFHLIRIVENKGVYIENVGHILKTKEGVPALISALDSKNQEEVGRARGILQWIHSPPDGPDRGVFPQSQEAWMQWWQTRGSKMSYQELWHNFGSHWQ